MPEARTPCPGCGATLPDRTGATHPYIGASAGCWAAYGDVLAREFDGPPPAVHRLTVDAYAAQHPGVPERRSIQSVCGHLVSLCAVLERGVPPQAATRLLKRIVEAKPPFRWLDPPDPIGELTIVDVRDHATAVEAWARSVWNAWEAHHDAVRQWLDPHLA